MSSGECEDIMNKKEIKTLRDLLSISEAFRIAYNYAFETPPPKYYSDVFDYYSHLSRCKSNCVSILRVYFWDLKAVPDECYKNIYDDIHDNIDEVFHKNKFIFRENF